MIATIVTLLTAVAGAAALAIQTGEIATSVTPHDKYSSSIGVLGCKINTNRVAYWPGWSDCDNLCVRVTHTASGRSVHLLRIDTSGGAMDISYDAWNYLSAGLSASTKPTQGGGIPVTYSNAPMSSCANLLPDGKLPLTAANSMNYVASCLQQPHSWAAQNHVLYNILNPVCTYGFDEVCSLDLAVSNQPACPHQLGLNTALTTCPVWDLQYGTGQAVKAL